MSAVPVPLASAAPLLELREVTQAFPVSGGLFRKSRLLHAVNGVSLSIARGEVVAIVGESGCGKTTLMRMMLGLLPPTSGSVSLEGADIARIGRRSVARRVQPIFQDPYSSLNPRKRIGTIVGFPLDVHGIGTAAERRARVIEVLGRCGLPEHFIENYPNQLSGGQRQRVAIARALIMKPDLVVCDEPTSALDVSVQSQILNLLAELREAFGLTYVVISHNLAVVEHIATRVVVMYLGRVVEEGTTEEVFLRPRHPYTRALLSAVLTPDPGQGIPDPGLGGQFPNPLDPPPGCAFHPRCGFATAQCRSAAPRFAHGVACHFPLAEKPAEQAA
ncbi:MAG TPA: oligopeptide/dipeptide ABC transporter ATP-binding protein [Usitatibacter sp.]|nr:oligopeptide/dipeptide ABC transporter ATP-binding protein [Usitatibacter sp.]